MSSGPASAIQLPWTARLDHRFDTSAARFKAGRLGVRSTVRCDRRSLSGSGSAYLTPKVLNVGEELLMRTPSNVASQLDLCGVSPGVDGRARAALFDGLLIRSEPPSRIIAVDQMDQPEVMDQLSERFDVGGQFPVCLHSGIEFFTHRYLPPFVCCAATKVWSGGESIRFGSKRTQNRPNREQKRSLRQLLHRITEVTHLARFGSRVVPGMRSLADRHLPFRGTSGRARRVDVATGFFPGLDGRARHRSLVGPTAALANQVAPEEQMAEAA